jgi:hypothetical protein
MAPLTYCGALVVGIVAGGLACHLESRRKSAAAALGVAAGALAVGLCSLYWAVTTRWPVSPTAWLSQAGREVAERLEPWEWAVAPLAIAVLAGAVLAGSVRSGPFGTWRLWCGLLLIGSVIAVALPAGESYSDVVPGNAVWSLVALLSVGANLLAMEQLERSGAGRWSLWVVVAQLATVSAIWLSCYATPGDWLLASTALVAGLGLARAAVPLPAGGLRGWQSGVVPGALALGGVMLPYVRIYSTQGLPSVLAAVVFLMPALVVAVDQLWGRYRSPGVRVLAAGSVSAALAGGTLAWVLLQGGASSDW